MTDHPDAWVVFCLLRQLHDANIWRGQSLEKREVSREVLILPSVALVADEKRTSS
jgi:hypothetical protein